MNINTTALVLKTVKYGDTSLICQILAEDLGMVSFIVKGVRTSKKSNHHANLLFPGALLNISFEHHPQRQLQYLKEFSALIKEDTQEETVLKNCIRMFCVEVLGHLVQEGHEQNELLIFYQTFSHYLYQQSDAAVSNAPLFFLIQAGKIAGYFVNTENDRNTHPYFSLVTGSFSKTPDGLTDLTIEESQLLASFLHTDKIKNALEINISNAFRRKLMQAYLAFLQYHTAGFKEIKCLSVLQVILS